MENILIYKAQSLGPSQGANRMAFKSVDEAVKFARSLTEYQAIYKKDGYFYNCSLASVPKGCKILVTVDQMNKEIINHYE